jgi:DNA modification methylase
MEIVNINVNELKPSEYNPRKMDKKEAKDLAESIKRFGLVDPIIVNRYSGRENVIVGGHQRYHVAKEMGIVEIPCVYVELSLEKERELNLRLNKNVGQWDLDLLTNFNEELLLDVGFDSDAVAAMFGLDLKEDAFDAEQEYENIKEPKTKLGDIYKLGDHKLMCGDAVKSEDLEKLLDGHLARLIFTDPPYNVNYKSPAGLSYSSKKYGGSGGKIFNDNKSDDECILFYTNVLKNLYNFSTEDATIYWWFANKNNWINRLAFDDSNWHMSQIIIWLKNSMVFSIGQDYHRMYEPCMLGWKRKKKHYSNKKISNLKDIFNLDFNDFNEMLDVWYEKRDLMINYVHPTQKPIRLAERALAKNSQGNDIVMDVFGGSGSTLIACEQTQRKCHALELDPKYCDVIIKRWEQWTGQKAQRLNQ